MPRERHLLHRASVLVLAALSMLFLVGGLHRFPRWWIAAEYGTLLGVALGHVTAVLGSAMAVVLVLRAWRRPEGRALALALAAAASSHEILFGGHGVLRALGIADLPGLGAVFEIWFFGGPLVALAALVRFTTLFPRTLTEEDVRWSSGSFEAADSFRWLDRLESRVGRLLPEGLRRRAHLDAGTLVHPRYLDDTIAVLRFVRSRWLYPTVAGAVGVLVGIFWIADGSGIDFGALAPGLVTALGIAAFVVLTLLFGLPLGIGWVFALFAVRLNYARANPEQRARALWIVEGMLAAVLILPVAAVLSRVLDERLVGTPWESVLYATALPAMGLVFVLAVAVATFYQGAFDPRLAIRRTTLYGMLGLVVTAVFAGVEAVVSDLVMMRMGVSGSWGGWIAGITAAMVFGPIRDLLRRRLDPAEAVRTRGSAPEMSVPSRPS